MPLAEGLAMIDAWVVRAPDHLIHQRPPIIRPAFSRTRLCILGISEKVDILVYDKQPEAIQTWRQQTAAFGMDMEYEELWRGAEHLPQCPIIIIDRSILGAGFVTESRQAASMRPHQLIIASGTELNVSEVVEMMQAGVGYVFSKPLDGKEIATKLPEFMKAVQGKQAEKREYEQLRNLFDSLTQKECDVLENVLRGVSNKKTAEQLSVSVRTIEARRAKVYTKTNSECVAELVRKVDRLSNLRQVFGSSAPHEFARAAGGPSQTRGTLEEHQNHSPRRNAPQRSERFSEEAHLKSELQNPHFATTLQLSSQSPHSEKMLAGTQSTVGSKVTTHWKSPGIN